MTSTERRRYTDAEVAAMIGKTEQWVRKEATAGRLPHRMFGKTRGYLDADIDEIFENARRAARAEHDDDSLRPAPSRRRRRP